MKKYNFLKKRKKKKEKKEILKVPHGEILHKTVNMQFEIQSVNIQLCSLTVKI